MPYINVRITEGATQSQKEEIIKRMTDTMVDVLGKNPKTVFVVIDEVSRNDWGVGGESIAAKNRKEPPIQIA